MTGLAHRLLAEEQEFRRTNKRWQRPSPVFRSTSARLPEPRLCTDIVYDGCIAEPLRKGTPTYQFKSNSPQRSPIRQPLTHATYDPPPLERIQNCVAFRSTTPRATATSLACDVAPTAQPREARPAVHSEKRRKNSAPFFLSKQPRFPPARGYVCQGDYTIKDSLSKPSKRPSPWARNQEPQRTPPKPAVDAMYETPAMLRVGSSCPTKRSMFVSTTPRFVDPVACSPPVGGYTSRFVSYGMQW
jgi:hypothetical protein